MAVTGTTDFTERPVVDIRHLKTPSEARNDSALKKFQHKADEFLQHIRAVQMIPALSYAVTI